MANAWQLFKEDLLGLKSNVIALVVALGLAFTPSLYAWFNLLAFWDPYAHTDRIPVAVADEDEGYQSPLVPTRVDAGQQVVDGLREAGGFDWQFVGADEAVEGVESGRYVAAIVIPETFSRDLLSVFSPQAERPSIDYYVNQKENAVAPRLTEEGVTEIQGDIDRQFAQTVAEVCLSTTNGLMEFLGGDGVGAYGQSLLGQLDEALEELDSAADASEALGALSGSLASLIEVTGDVIDENAAVAEVAAPLTSEARDTLEGTETTLESLGRDLTSAASRGQSALDSVQAAADDGLDAVADVVPGATKALADAAADAQAMAGAYRSLAQALASPRPSSTPSSAGAYRSLAQALAQVDSSSPAVTAAYEAASSLETLAKDLREASEDASALSGDVTSAKGEVADDVDGASQALSALADAGAALDGSKVSELTTTIEGAIERIDAMGSSVQAITTEIEGHGEDLVVDLEDAQDALEGLGGTLRETEEGLQTARDDLADALASGDLARVRTIIGSDPGATAAFLAAPTEVVRHPVWPVANNGSAMAPFYLSLAIWIGSVFEIALMETTVEEPRRRAVEAATGKPLTPGECYWGRYGVFCALALVQATILVLGAMLYLGIQCEHPILMLISAWVDAIVFSNIIYTLVLSFGRVGEAICVIGLVAQVAGSGGIFPVVLSAPVFQAIYPFLPFVHTMGAFESCIAGGWVSQFVQPTLITLAFLIPSLTLGLVLRRPVMRLAQWFDSQLEKSKLIFRE